MLWFLHQLFHQSSNLSSGACTLDPLDLSVKGHSLTPLKEIPFFFVAGVPHTPPKLGTWSQPGTSNADGNVSPPPPAAGTPMISSVAKVVQPTATVSSVPVCGPSK